MTTRLTCRLCTAPYQANGYRAQLCANCRADLTASKAHIEHTQQAAINRANRNVQTFDTLLAQSSDKARYEAVQAARLPSSGISDERLERSIAAALAKCDGLSEILEAEARRDAVVIALAGVMEWARLALVEVERAAYLRPSHSTIECT